MDLTYKSPFYFGEYVMEKSEISDLVKEIEDVDEFLDELLEVNEKSQSDSPSLEDFCNSFNL